ncbi:MAG TPA: hypothetical protein PKC87_00290 [Candidatus Absconditabacterales bacterium]|nr:hypothetical protein [Candidatus Absconditabacterales bacterium]
MLSIQKTPRECYIEARKEDILRKVWYALENPLIISDERGQATYDLSLFQEFKREVQTLLSETKDHE